MAEQFRISMLEFNKVPFSKVSCNCSSVCQVLSLNVKFILEATIVLLYSLQSIVISYFLLYNTQVSLFQYLHNCGFQLSAESNLRLLLIGLKQLAPLSQPSTSNLKPTVTCSHAFPSSGYLYLFRVLFGLLCCLCLV